MTDVDDRSKNTHAICEACWVKQFPDRWPTRVIGQDPSIAYVCCFCGSPTWVGIYLHTALPPRHCRHDISITERPAMNGHEHEHAEADADNRD